MDNRTAWIELLAAHEASRDRNRVTTPFHRPNAAILTCSDARVPPSVIFDQPAGSLFVVRVAGNSATPAAVASLDYAVAELQVPLIVVLGHTNCGAVSAACSGLRTGYLEALTAQICDLVDDKECFDAEQLAVRNVSATVLALRESDSPTGRAIRERQVMVRGAIYDLATDEIRPLTTAPTNLPNPLSHVNPFPALSLLETSSKGHQ